MSVEALVAWAVAGGAYLDPIEIRVGADGNRSVFARRAIARGELLLAVPRAMMIGHADASASAIGAAMQGFATMFYSMHTTLAAWMALERRDRTTPWTPFLDALPDSFPTPTPAAIAALAGTRAGEMLEEDERELENDRSLLIDLIPEMASVASDDLDWGVRVARSRCFQVAQTGGRALVPVADMFDHAWAAEAVWSYRPEESHFEVRATHELAAGTELRFHYGKYSNARWLAYYGVVLENNSDDEVTLRFAPGNAVHVGTRFDARFHRAMRAAHVISGDSDPRTALRVVHEVSRQADERIRSRDADVVHDPAWKRKCQIVRAGERSVLGEIAIFATRAMESLTGPQHIWRALAESIAPEAIGADRLLRGFLLALT